MMMWIFIGKKLLSLLSKGERAIATLSSFTFKLDRCWCICNCTWTCKSGGKELFIKEGHFGMRVRVVLLAYFCLFTVGQYH